jgi:hypothetical protein
MTCARNVDISLGVHADGFLSTKTPHEINPAFHSFISALAVDPTRFLPVIPRAGRPYYYYYSVQEKNP